MQHSGAFHFIHTKFGISNSLQYPDIGQNSDGDISDFRISGQSLTKENCCNSRTSDDMDMKLGPLTKLDKKNKTTPKNVTMTLCRQIVPQLPFFPFLANLEQCGSRIPDTLSVKLIFSLIVTFYLTKYETELKKSLTLLSHYCFE